MEYPDDFDVPANPAGKRIAISRTVAIWTSVVFLIIAFLCFIIFWSYKSQTVSSVLISVGDNGQWESVGQTSNDTQIPAFQTMQEYVIGNFVKNWFYISINENTNNEIWQKCDREICRNGGLTFGTGTCALYCASGEDVYSRFSYDVLPYYKSITNSENWWNVDMENINIKPMGRVSKIGGNWYVIATIKTNRGDFKIRAFVKVVSNRINYPHTMGFYVADFNAYRMEQ